MNLNEGSIVATATKKAAAKADTKPAGKAAPKSEKKSPVKDQPVELTPIDDGVTVNISDGHYADLNIKGRFDLDGLISVAKRVNQARAELS